MEGTECGCTPVLGAKGRQVLLLGLLGLLPFANGFVHTPGVGTGLRKLGPSINRVGRARTAATSMMLSPNDLVDHVDAAWLAHVLQGVADAAAPAAEEAAKAAPQPGVFDQFVGLVRNSIETLHSGLVSIGIKQSYGLSIILFTTTVKMLLLPVTYKQLESSQRIQSLAPKAKELKEKYGRNKALLNQLTAKLYENANVNPLAGCLPALAQIPIFLALYRSLLQLAQEQVLDEPFLWLPSLAGPLYGMQRGMGWLTENWVDGTPSLGWPATIAFLTIPVILVVTQTISQNLLSPPTQSDDPQAARTQAVLKYLPFMLGYFSLSVPAGLGVYWITNNLVSTGISLAIKETFKKNPVSLDVDVDPKDLGYDPALVAMSYEDMMEEARKNLKPSRQRKRSMAPPSQAGAGMPSLMAATPEKEKVEVF